MQLQILASQLFSLICVVGIIIWVLRFLVQPIGLKEQIARAFETIARKIRDAKL